MLLAWSFERGVGGGTVPTNTQDAFSASCSTDPSPGRPSSQDMGHVGHGRLREKMIGGGGAVQINTQDSLFPFPVRVLCVCACMHSGVCSGCIYVYTKPMKNKAKTGGLVIKFQTVCYIYI